MTHQWKVTFLVHIVEIDFNCQSTDFDYFLFLFFYYNLGNHIFQLVQYVQV